MSAADLRAIANTNAAIAANHKPHAPFSSIPNMKATVLITCMDPRANPKDFWTYGDAACIRNVGGCVTEDTLRSIRFLAGVMSDRRNTVGVVAVIHHTDCGLHDYTEEDVRESLAERAGLGEEERKMLEREEFLSWKSSGIGRLEETVWRDMRKVREDPFLPKEMEVLGFVYDVFSGVTTEVGQL